MISMPLMMIPMLPAARLDLGTSLIPVSGLMLLLRGLIEGEYAEVIRYVGPVCAVTLVCCYVAIRWVVYQFNSESVLFRASERFGVGAWFQHVMRERHELPSMGSAVMLGVTILVLKFFIGFAIQAPNNWFEFTKQVIVVLVASIGVPTALMALIMTRSPRKTLRLRWCSFPVACAAVLTAICLHPMIMWFSGLVMYIYPPAGDLVFMESMMTKILGSAPGLWAIILVFAIAPAIVEEFAFRGFILSGFETLKNRWQAVLITSLLFGLAHSVIQQTMITFVVGMILGLIAVTTRSIIPCILYHATHNGLSVILSRTRTATVEASPILKQLLYSSDGTSYQYSLLTGILLSLIGVALIVWFLKLETNKEPSPPDGLLDLSLAVPKKSAT
jgi:sodium transport system permease protein